VSESTNLNTSFLTYGTYVLPVARGENLLDLPAWNLLKTLNLLA
jgi:hypothetical protein